MQSAQTVARPGPRRDVDPQVAQLGSALDRITRLLRRADLPGALSPVAASSLYTLVTCGPSRLTALAAAEHVTQPAMSQAIGRMEAAGLVTRTADPDDGRAVLVSCTEAGRELSAQRRAVRAATLGDLLEGLQPHDRERLLAALPALEKLAALGDEALPPDRSPPPGR